MHMYLSKLRLDKEGNIASPNKRTHDPGEPLYMSYTNLGTTAGLKTNNLLSHENSELLGPLNPSSEMLSVSHDYVYIDDYVDLIPALVEEDVTIS